MDGRSQFFSGRWAVSSDPLAGPQAVLVFVQIGRNGQAIQFCSGRLEGCRRSHCGIPGDPISVQVDGNGRAIAVCSGRWEGVERSPCEPSAYPVFCSGRWEWTGDLSFAQVGGRV